MGITHIINIFLNPENYIYINKEEQKLEKRILKYEQKTNTMVNKMNINWNLLDFDSKYLRNKTLVGGEIDGTNETKDNNNKNVNKNINNEINQKLNNKLNNSDLFNKLKLYIKKLDNEKISLIEIDEIIKEINKFNLGINFNEEIPNIDININDQQKLIDEFFSILMDKPEAIYYAKNEKK